MYEHEVRGDRAVYDHETEDAHGARRRRPVADWGVGEELFDRMPSPRRRFARTGEPVRRDAHARDHRTEPEPLAAAETERLAAADTEPLGTVAPEATAPEREPVPAAAPADGGIEGRRTIVIGRNEGAAATRRSRPPRTAGERLGHRPDRIAAWAVALGLLLIVIAFATAGA
jgi:hypothetical protein